MEKSNNRFEIIHETIQKSNNQLSVRMLCEIAGVSRSGYYNWVNAEEARLKKEEQDRVDFELIVLAYNHRGYDNHRGYSRAVQNLGVIIPKIFAFAYIPNGVSNLSWIPHFCEGYISTLISQSKKV